MEFPNQEFTVTDDESALALITHWGLLGDFLKYEGLSNSHMGLVKHVGHPTHWFVAVRFAGHTNPADNGYVVYGFPKSQFPIKYVMEHIAMLEKQHGDGSGDAVSHFPKRDRN
jgi:hypothetical protein